MFINKNVNENFSDIINRKTDDKITAYHIGNLTLVEVELIAGGEIKYLFKDNKALMKIKVDTQLPSFIDDNKKDIVIIVDRSDDILNCLSIDVNTLEIEEKIIKTYDILNTCDFIPRNNVVFLKKKS